MVESIRKFLALLRKTIIWIIIYFLIGIALIIFGNIIKENQVLSPALIAIGASFLAIALVSIIVEVSTSWHVLEIMHLYGDHKTHGIYRVFQNSKDLEYIDFYKKCKSRASRIKILTLVGRDYFGNNGAVSKTIEMAKRATEFHIIVIKIDSDGYKYQYDNYEPTKDDADVAGLSNKEIFIENFQKVKKYIESLNSEKKELRFYEVKPVFKLEFFDEYLFVSFYGKNVRAANYSPILVFKKHKSSDVYKYFVKQFENYGKKEKNE